MAKRRSCANRCGNRCARKDTNPSVRGTTLPSEQELRCLVLFLASQAFPDEFENPLEGLPGLGDELVAIHKNTIKQILGENGGDARYWIEIAKYVNGATAKLLLNNI